MKAKIGFSVFLILSLMACGSTVSDAPKRAASPPPLIGKLKAKSLDLGDNEKIIVVDVPDFYIQRRCVIYVGVRSSNMDCTFDSADNAASVTASGETD